MLGSGLVWPKILVSVWGDVPFFQQTPVSVCILPMGVKRDWPGLVGEQIGSQGHYSVRIVFHVSSCWLFRWFSSYLVGKCPYNPSLHTGSFPITNPTPILISPSSPQISFWSMDQSRAFFLPSQYANILNSVDLRSPISSGLCLFQLGSHSQTTGSGFFFGYPGTLAMERSTLTISD